MKKRNSKRKNCRGREREKKNKMHAEKKEKRESNKERTVRREHARTHARTRTHKEAKNGQCPTAKRSATPFLGNANNSDYTLQWRGTGLIKWKEKESEGS
jgi:hypothetical protein